MGFVHIIMPVSSTRPGSAMPLATPLYPVEKYGRLQNKIHRYPLSRAHQTRYNLRHCRSAQGIKMRFFISYSRSLRKKVEAVVDLLRAAGHEVWWDADIPPSADWWSTILDEIETCQVMIFMVSEKSVASPYCMDEFRYADARNRPVLPFIIDDHSRYVLPSEFGRRQRFIDDGDPARMLKVNHRCLRQDQLDSPQRPLQPAPAGTGQRGGSRHPPIPVNVGTLCRLFGETRYGSTSDRNRKNGLRSQVVPYTN